MTAEKAKCGCVIGGIHEYACASVGHVDPPRPATEKALTPMDRLAVAQGRRTEAEARVCSDTTREWTDVLQRPRVGCPGDGRYQPPGRGHLPDCPHDAVTWTWEQVYPPASEATPTCDQPFGDGYSCDLPEGHR